MHNSNWNIKFQQLVSLPHDDPTKHEQLIVLGQEFATAAKKWGAIIIAEHHLPDHRKSIPPTTRMGGVAGGMKYVKDGILFKFSIDTPIQRHGRVVGWMYGGSNCNHV
jgi:Clustered mitochondria